MHVETCFSLILWSFLKAKLKTEALPDFGARILGAAAPTTLVSTWRRRGGHGGYLPFLRMATDLSDSVVSFLRRGGGGDSER